MNTRRYLPVGLIVGILLSSTIPVPVSATSLSYELVDVHTAYGVLMGNQGRQRMILDIRSECEYRLTHLHDAISIPFDHLESRIDELSGLKDREVLVYCMTGATSQRAAEILVIHGFMCVSSLSGGIVAWLEAEYPVWTASHYVSMNNGNSFSSKPLLAVFAGFDISTSDCTSCQDFDMIGDVNRTTHEEDEYHRTESVSVDVNGTLFEATATTRWIWGFSEGSKSMNESVSFVSFKITVQGIEMLGYRLQYSIQHVEYTLGLNTVIYLADSDSYNSSMTIVAFKPNENPANIVSLEAIEFTESRNLSSIYRGISFIAKKTGNQYSHASDGYLNTLSDRYDLIHKHTKHLSKIVKRNLRSFDLDIERSFAVLYDPCDLECWAFEFHSCYGAIGAVTLACLLAAVVVCAVSGPLFGPCIGPFIVVCGVIDFALAVFCAVEAYLVCCWDTGGGGGCPILSVYNGTTYVSEGLLDIHSESDTIRTCFLQTDPSPLANRYLLRLTEHNQTRSHLDEVRLFGRIDDGRIIEIPLLAARHVAYGNVLYQLSSSDDIRVDMLGANYNDGTSH